MRKSQILILDFDPAVLGVMEQLLEARGWDTTTTWDMDEARQLLSARGFTAVIAGHHPPEIQAEQILNHAQQRKQPPRCIVTLADVAYPFEVEHMKALGAHAVVSKWDQRELMAIVEGLAPGTFRAASD